MFGLKKVTQCILAALFLLALHSMWSGSELLKMQGVTEDTVEAAPFPNETSRSTAPPPQCSSDYFAPRQAKLFAGPLFDSRKNKQRYKAFRAEFEMYTGRDPLHTFNVVKFQTGGIQYTDLHNSHDHKTLVLGCKDKALRESTSWTNWYYAPTGPTDFSTCETILPGTAVFFRGMSFGRFIYGALLHDILPPVLWMYDNEPNATPVFEIEKSGKVVDFMKWFDPFLHSRALYVPAGKTVCAESLLVMVPHHDIVHPEILRSAQLFTHLRQHFFKIHSQNPVNSVVYLYRNPKIAGNGRLVVPEDAVKVRQMAEDSLKRHGRSESLVLFDGTWEGKSASFAQQFQIFNSAAVAFGPHGTGFSNVLWMPCTGRPAAIEFICSEMSYKVRGCTMKMNGKEIPRVATYWGMHGGSTWLRYFHVMVADVNETLSNFMRVDLDGFQLAMDKALAGLPSSK